MYTHLFLVRNISHQNTSFDNQTTDIFIEKLKKKKLKVDTIIKR